MVGIVLNKVKELGLSESTIVMFLWGHGWHLGKNSLWGKKTAFEQRNHKPLMINIPGVTEEWIVSDALVEFIEMFPTLIEAAGLPSVPSCPKSVLKPVALSQNFRKNKMVYSIKTEM